MLSKLIGPFAEIITMANLPLKGPLADESLEIVPDGGLIIEDGRIQQIGSFRKLTMEMYVDAIEEISRPMVCLPGFIDCHTHICFAGSRARDYAMRVACKPYIEIAKAGGGILDTVGKTRTASQEALEESLFGRCDRLLSEGVTTCEVKSGYGLNVENELIMLHAIRAVDARHTVDLVPTCLAAHMPPKDFNGTPSKYLLMIIESILPQVFSQNLAKRVDIFIEESAFSVEEAKPYLKKAKDMGFSLAMHVDQFTAGGSHLAVELGAISADHLEASTDLEVQALAGSNVIAVVLPGASLGLGDRFAPARKLLDAGASVAISTDWNPGSAPMGDLLMQAAVLSAAEKLTTAETLAGLTVRAAAALELTDRGLLAPGKTADFIGFACDDYREIMYNQGKLKPANVWKDGLQQNSIHTLL